MTKLEGKSAEQLTSENPERIFPILNKFDRIYTHYGDKPFCEVYQMVTQDKQLSDLDFTQVMDQYIDDNNIK